MNIVYILNSINLISKVMKNKMRLLKLTGVLLFTTIFVFACSDKDFILLDEQGLDFVQENTIAFDREAFVSSEQATRVAEMFLKREVKNGVGPLKNVSVETVKDNNNNPSMYIVNYPEGGWIIVGATKNYYPVLAYSCKGSFKIKPEIELGGFIVWLEETKAAVKASAALADSIKARMHGLWQAYDETNKIKPLDDTKSYQDFQNRINQLYLLYSPSGWLQFVSLENASWYLDYYTWQNLVDIANSYVASLEYSIVGIKQTTAYKIVNPKITTLWHQRSPYNDFFPSNASGNRYDAGCAAIAMANVMKYHKYSANSITWSDYTVNWNDLPDSYATNSVKALIRHAADKANMSWGIFGLGTFSWATPNNVTNGLRSYGYTVSQVSHNYTSARNELLNNEKPILMLGFDSYPFGGHYWTSSGIEDWNSDKYYFVEFYTGSYNDYGRYPITNPGHINTKTTYFYMNWGWGGLDDGWFLGNNVNPPSYNFNSNTVNFYIDY